MPNAAPKASEGVRLHGISQAAFDLIVEFEVSSEETYNARYRRPTKPGGSSGITIGIGYDCGYSTAAQIRVDWGGLLPADMIVALMTVAGVTGASAALALPAVRDKVDVPWIAALAARKLNFKHLPAGAYSLATWRGVQGSPVTCPNNRSS